MDAGGFDGAEFQRARGYRLDPPGDPMGVSCGAAGPCLGPVRLLQPAAKGFAPRPRSEIEFVLARAFGHPVDFASRMGGLQAAARALGEGAPVQAMLATQFMRLPVLTSPAQYRRALEAEALLAKRRPGLGFARANFNPDEPRDRRGRWTDEGAGGGSGEGSGEGSGGGADEAALPEAAPGEFIPVQALGAMPVPPEILSPFEFPPEQILPIDPELLDPKIPGDILPPTTDAPTIAPRDLKNPFPNDPECEEEWREAKEYCGRLRDKKLLGTRDYRAQGRTYEQCLRGRVSERCGGSPVDRSRNRPRRGSSYEIFA